MKSHQKTPLALGLILAFFFSALSVTALAETSTSSSKSKKHHSKKSQPAKQQVKKGKRSVVKNSKSKHTDVSKSVTKKSVNDETAKLSTDINFNDSVLHGRYQTPDEATAKVENEKSLADLLAVRTEFKDRLKKASEQN